MDIRKYFVVNGNFQGNGKSNSKSVDKSSDKLLDKSNKNENEIEIEKKTKYNIFEAFADGSSFNNGSKNKSIRRGGIGVYFPNYSEHISQPLDKSDKITNNVAELLACIEAIKFFIGLSEFNKDCDKIILYTDSLYTINSMTNWAHTWRKNDWRKYNSRKRTYQEIQNKELMIQLYNLTHPQSHSHAHSHYRVQYVHVRSHQPEPTHLSQDDVQYKIWLGNKIADKLATDASKKSSNIV